MQKKLSTAWINRLFMRLHGIFGERWLKNFDNNVNVLEAAKESWSVALGDMSAEEIKSAIEYCDLGLEWPPTPAQFRKYGKRQISEEEALQQAIRRNFDNPIVKIAFNKIGSWDMSHLDDKSLRKKWSASYQEAIKTAEYQQIDSNALLSSDKLKALPSHIQHKNNATEGSTDHLSGIVGRINGLKKENNNKTSFDEHFLVGKSSVWWSPFKYNPSKRGFDKQVHLERRNYLIKLTEEQALSRSLDDQYDRMRYLTEDEANATVNAYRRRYAMENPTPEDNKAKNEHRERVQLPRKETRYHD